MKPRREKFNYFEVIFRIRSHSHQTLSEYTMRDGKAYIVNYWPDGTIHSHGVMTLDQFIEEVAKIRDADIQT